MGCLHPKSSKVVTSAQQETDPRPDGAKPPKGTRKEKSKTPEVSSSAVPTSPAKTSLSPPRKTKERLIPDPSIFHEVDEYVKRISKTPANSIEQLAKVLTKNYSSDLLKIRALFTWMTLNVRYDTESFFSGNYSSQESASVLQTGKAVCEGYAELFDALCKVANIPCIKVSGIAKGYSHDPEDVYTATSKTNHSWNLVLVQGEWRPLESTWGAGHVTRGRGFVRQFEDRWFLTDPQEFVLRHFPLMNGNLKESEKYQLLKKPMTIEQYSAHVLLETEACALGLKCLTHQKTVIDVIRDVTIKVKAELEPLENMSVELVEQATQVKDSTNVLLSLDGEGRCTIYVRPPRAATYLLKVNGRSKSQDPTKLYQLVTYVIRCSQPETKVEPFPANDGVWGLRNPTARECGVQLHPKKDTFMFTAKKGEATVPIYMSHYVTLKTKLLHAGAMENDLAPYTFIEYTKGRASVRARLSKRGYYMLRIFASHPTKDSLQQAADILLFNGGEFPCVPFPHAYPTAYSEQAQLLSPLTAQVPAGKPTLYRVKAPSLGKLKVANRQMELKNDDVWEAEVTPPEGEDKVTIFGAAAKDAASLSGLFAFTVEG